jgi:nucleoside-diphosphate-sugar epimerase
MGYVGSVLCRHLKTSFPTASLIGYDAGFFSHCLTAAPVLPETVLDRQIFGDIRDFPGSLLDGVDAVVHLAAVSNDPMGNRFESVTEAINHHSSIRLARLAAEQGVRRFVFASSCSTYGTAVGEACTEDAPLNPLTAYARSKVATERDLATLANSGMLISCLRFSTACGMSPRLRLDLVLNDFVASALAAGEITVLSDGTPWRPLIDVKDMARAIEWALTRERSCGGSHVMVNVGADHWNYQVRDLAEAVVQTIPGVRVNINKDAPPDKRSYRVDFSLYRQLAPGHQPQVSLSQAISEIKQGLELMYFNDSNFRSSQFMRLKVLERQMAERRLTEELRWCQGDE